MWASDGPMTFAVAWADLPFHTKRKADHRTADREECDFPVVCDAFQLTQTSN